MLVSAAIAPALSQTASQRAQTTASAAAPDSEPSQTAQPTSANSVDESLQPSDLQQLQALKIRDREVRAHEMAHAAAGGQYVTSGAQYSYQKGPDGQRYAVAGEVGINTAPIAGDPRATLLKAQTIMRAALAPAEPSSQDRQVAARAAAMQQQARVELQSVQYRQPEDEQTNSRQRIDLQA